MKKKLGLIVVTIISLLVTTGCGPKILKVDDKKTTEQIIAYIEKDIYEQTSDIVTAKTVSIEKLQVCTAYFDSCITYQNVKNGNSYTIEITNGSIKATGKYKDGYTNITDGYSREADFDNDYIAQKALFEIKTEFQNALEGKTDKYAIYTDITNPSGYDIFILSNNYDNLNEILNSLKNTVIKYRNENYTSYNVYIYKDQKGYNEINFEIFNNLVDEGGQSHASSMIPKITNKNSTQLLSSENLTEEIFNKDYENDSQFDYIIYCIDAEPNSFVGYNKGDMAVYGVK